MIPPNTLIFECPACGQGGLEQVLIKLMPPIPAVVCQECERLWVSPAKVDLKTDTLLDLELPRLGLSPTWESLETVKLGVAFEDLADDYRQILNLRANAAKE